ncbi:hypothetical protein SD77_1940 [Bacillus badius]|uniref:Ribose 5-phosphate isomerase B n=1 Tax=Bacillus badius TaxID=1455 RepID=A0ABR5AQF3_BACBA|nr:hypothetical protein SD77_1940 [Bacillus badius]
MGRRHLIEGEHSPLHQTVSSRQWLETVFLVTLQPALQTKLI